MNKAILMLILLLMTACTSSFEIEDLPEITGDACDAENGRIVNTLSQKNCDSGEEAIGTIKDLDCPCVCCAAK